MLRDWPPRSSIKDRETFGSVATQWSWRSYREQRSRRGEYHTVMLGNSRKKKDRPYVQSTSGLTSFSRNGNGEQKIHYVRRTRDVADATESTRTE